MGPPTKDKRSMSAVDYHEYQRVVTWMEDQEALRLGRSVKSVRPALARDMGIAPGTLEDIRKGRLKGLRGRVERAIDSALVRFLERQQRGIDHEIGMANARLERGDPRVVAKATAARDALDVLIGEAK